MGILSFLLKHKYRTVFSRKRKLRLLQHLLEKSSIGMSLAQESLGEELHWHVFGTNDLTSHRDISFVRITISFINRCKVFISGGAGRWGRGNRCYLC